MSRIINDDVCIHCACAIDDDGVLYCSEDVCIREEASNVNKSCVQQAAAP